MSHDRLQEEMRCEETHSRLKPPSVVTATPDFSLHPNWQKNKDVMYFA